VSVIIPVYNGERYIGAALESVLAQTSRPGEILVIDDGSSDGTAAVLEAYRPHVRYHYQPNAGLSVARNCGVRLATRDFLAFLDADDLWTAEKLDLQMRALTRDDELEAVFGHMRQFYSPDVSDGARAVVRYSREVVAGYHADTLLIRRRAFQRIGFFATDLRAGFLNWFARAREQGLRSRVLPEVVALRRVHDANMGVRERSLVRAEYVRILKSALDRRRATSANH
jgi:glycosyltransferase involved in cell wall biosynthesis